MTGPDESKQSNGTGEDEYAADSAGGVTTVTTQSPYPNATPFSDDSAVSPYGATSSADTTGTGSTGTTSSAWSGSPYEPLPSDAPSGAYPSDPFPAYSESAATPTYVPPAVENQRPAAPIGGRQTKSRAVAALVSAALGTLLVGGGLYLIGEFGFRIFEVMLNNGGQPSPWDIAWTSTGAALIFAAVLLNGWSPWATLLPGLALTAAGVWSLAWYDGADRVATFIDRLFARPEMVVWGITGWLLVLGLLLVGASGAAIIARAAGRRRGRPVPGV
jgi:hypothetical protein